MDKVLNTKNRYWLFGGDCYYPRGGMGDFINSFETLELALQHYNDNTVEYDWCHVYDTENHTLIKYNGG